MAITFGASGITFNDATSQSSAATSSIPSGTNALFQQTAAPTGWTKSTSHNDKAFRIVSGTASTGDSVAFSTGMSNFTPTGNTAFTVNAGNTTLSVNQVPAHNHTVNRNYNSGGNNKKISWVDNGCNPYNWGPYGGFNNSGGGGAHKHNVSMTGTFTGDALDFSVQYIDVIIASKD